MPDLKPCPFCAGWQPMETAPKDRAILRPHMNWGPMAVEPNPLVNRKAFPWMNVSMDNTWPEEAFLPFWMPLPPAPAAEEAAKR